jgi:beta-alanine--pyruvate transaminase
MPSTRNTQFKNAPRLLASAAGMNYIAADGKTVLDGTAGLWCVNAGHGRVRIGDAVYRQLGEMDYAPSFQMSHPIAFEYAEMLAKNAPGGACVLPEVSRKTETKLLTLP